jgi:hypothetical protein
MGGILVPLVVLQIAPNRYVLIDGQRRYMSATKLKMKTVPANVISGDMSDTENLCAMFSIHMAREPWDPASRALALGELKKLNPNIPEERLEQITGMTRENIEDANRILRFPRDLIDRCLLEGKAGYLRPANLVEMAKAIEVIDTFLPDFFKKRDREHFIRILIEKRDKMIIERNTDFRLIKTMYDELPATKVEALLDRLIKESDLGIAEVFESVEDLIASKKFSSFKKSCQKFLDILRDFRPEKLDQRLKVEATEILEKIKREIEKKKAGA